MLWTAFVTILLLWCLGIVMSFTLSSLIHLLPLMAAGVAVAGSIKVRSSSDFRACSRRDDQPCYIRDSTRFALKSATLSHRSGDWQPRRPECTCPPACLFQTTASRLM